MSYGPYSPHRQAGNIYFISGQVGINPDTKAAAKDIKRQTAQALENLNEVLVKNGLGMAQVVKTTIFLKDMADFDDMNSVYSTYFSDPRPARSCVEVAGLPQLADNELLIEIEATAYIL
ncbi:MAG TPA: RidA family protein [Candidatus Limnocylindrales bacterium]|nr:RidA family protein [Candidatus Limnocylindrales bacterium]